MWKFAAYLQHAAAIADFFCKCNIFCFECLPAAVTFYVLTVYFNECIYIHFNLFLAAEIFIKTRIDKRANCNRCSAQNYLQIFCKET